MTSQSLKGVRVLLVEDDADARELYEMALEQAGAEVRGTGEAREAMLVLLEWSPHVIVSDLTLPDLDGRAFLGAVRAMPHLQTVPAIVISGWTQPEDRQATFAAGFQEHLAKPLGADKLVAVVGRWASGAAQT